MITAAIIKSLQVYGIAIVVSLVVAVLIKVLVLVTARMEKRPAVEVPTGSVCPVLLGVPEEDVAALSAAIFAAIGPHLSLIHICCRLANASAPSLSRGRSRNSVCMPRTVQPTSAWRRRRCPPTASSAVPATSARCRDVYKRQRM